MKHSKETPLWLTTIKYWSFILVAMLIVGIVFMMHEHASEPSKAFVPNKAMKQAVSNSNVQYSSSSSSESQEFPTLDTSVENYIRTFSSGDVRAVSYRYTPNGYSLNITYTQSLGLLSGEQRLNIIGDFFTSLAGHPHGQEIKLTVYVEGQDSPVGYMDFNKYEDYITGQKVGW